MALDRKWLFAINTFITSARSDENAMKQIFFHDTAIKAFMDSFPLDLDYPAWYARFHPLREDANTKYTNFYSIEGDQIGQTSGVDARLKAIKGKAGKARDWYTRVAAIYAVTNPSRFKAIFPQGLKPFRGAKDAIITALKTLSKNIGTDANLWMVDIKDEVDAEYAIINPERTVQKSAKKITKISRTTLEESITAALDMQFGDLGLEINKFRSDPEMETKIKAFHDLELIQSRQQKLFHITLTPPETKELATRTMVFNSQMRAATTGGDVNIYLASKPGATDSDAVYVKDGTPKKFAASEFNVDDYGVHRYITIVTAAGKTIALTLQFY